MAASFQLRPLHHRAAKSKMVCFPQPPSESRREAPSFLCWEAKRAGWQAPVALSASAAALVAQPT